MLSKVMPRVLAFSVLAVLGSEAAFAQAYPTKSIKLVVPYSAGGATDTSARYIAHKLSEVLGQPIVIENQPGAAGVIAYGTVAKAAADGYTLIYATTSIVTTKALKNDVPYDALTDFAPITTLLDVQSVMIVKPDLAVKSVMDVVDLAKREKGQMTYASLGQGSEPHLMMEMFKTAAKVDLQAVPFKVTPQIFTDMMANRIDTMLCLMPSALPFIKSNRLRGLGVSGPTRSPALPDTPTIREAGVRDFAQTFWSGLMAPKGTPVAVLNKLHDAAHKVLADPVVQTWAIGVGAETRGSTAAGFTTYLREQSAVWTELATKHGLKAE
jgi:tripartite-type tricarboxylate transporter receptor subunit TctC